MIFERRWRAIQDMPRQRGEGLDSGHHWLTVVDSPHSWQAIPWNSSKPSFVFSIC